MSTLQIVNTSIEEIHLPRRTYQPPIIIPSRGKKQFSTGLIEDKTDYEIHYIEYDYTKAKRIPVQVPAETICADFFGNEKLKERGCFVKPALWDKEKKVWISDITPDDIQLARDNRKAWLEMLVEAGDDEYLQTKRVDQIPTVCKRACRELGVKREWAVVAPNATVQCEACAGRVELLDNGKPPILCTFCHFPLDRERAIEAGLWSPPNTQPISTAKQKEK